MENLGLQNVRDRWKLVKLGNRFMLFLIPSKCYVAFKEKIHLEFVFQRKGKNF